MPEADNLESKNLQENGILDAVMQSEQAHALADFNPDVLAADLLKILREREQEILSLRYGLGQSGEGATLEHIGGKLRLTRERVRQVEQESLKTLRASPPSERTVQSLGIIRKTIADHGGIFAQYALVEHLLFADQSERMRNALLFLLELSDEFHLLQETDRYHTSWHIKDFEVEKLDQFHTTVKVMLERSGNPMQMDELKSAFRQSEVYEKHRDYFDERVIENLLRITKHVRANPFGEYGLYSWRVIRPKDVGDKAYLVLKHYKQPLHYTKITEHINQHRFDGRTAFKETVHNELIMDPRFVLVGRGIYALAEWGYKKGLVSDVIAEILQRAGAPMERNDIITEVLKHRLVRRNTILVGLANKKLFRKVGKNKYTLVGT